MATYYYYGWTHEEEKILIEIMNSGRSRRKKVGDLLEEVAVKLERTVAACSNRWYEIRKDKAV